MNAVFDKAASNYDVNFTNTLIGKSQRARVWAYLEKHLTDQAIQILELNCGTGEDAIFLEKLGHQVLATDVSQEMLAVAKRKSKSIGSSLSFRQVDILDLDQHHFDNKFDAVFSNFGGMNCLSPKDLIHVSEVLDDLLKPNGLFIAVVMPNYCLLEKLYFLAKLNFAKATSRKKNKASLVNVNGLLVKTWYYAPNYFLELFTKHFHHIDTQLIGLIPSYLNSFFTKRRKLFGMIIRIENRLLGKKKGQNISDHYLIAMRLK